MTVPTLSVVIPVCNEAAHLPATLEALLEAVEESSFTAELVLVDDGSTDGSADVARRVVGGRLPLTVLSQRNRGRLAARRAGLEAAEAELTLLLDGRVRLLSGALRFVHGRVARGERVWSGHVHVDAENAFGTFWRLLAELAWRDYFDKPRTTSFGVEDFDRYPKGTTCLLAPRELLLLELERFESRYADLRNANDDTPVLRALAEHERFHVSPEFACHYTPRGRAIAFLKHSVRRGEVFLDGHGRPESRFFPAAVAFFPLSAGLLAASLRRPWLLPAAAAACGLAAGAYGAQAGRTREEISALVRVTPLYAVAHGLGMWLGLGRLLEARVAQ